MGDAREEGRRLVEDSPREAERPRDAFLLERSEEPEEGLARPVLEVEGAGDPRHDLLPERARAQKDPVLDDRDEEVSYGDRLLRARAAEEGDLEAAEDGPEDHVPEPSLGEVDDLGEESAWARPLLGP